MRRREEAYAFSSRPPVADRDRQGRRDRLRGARRTGGVAEEQVPDRRPEAREVDLDEHGGRAAGGCRVSRLARRRGSSLAGPCIVEEPASTTLVLPGQTVYRDTIGEPRDRGGRVSSDAVHDGCPAGGIHRRSRRDVRLPPAHVAVPGDLRGARLRRRRHRRARRARLARQRHRRVPRAARRGRSRHDRPRPGSRPRETSSRRTIPTRAAGPICPTSRWCGRSSLGGDLLGFAAAKGHWTEVGGKDPGSWTADSRDVFQEGLQLPFVRVVRGGELDRDLVAVLRREQPPPRHEVLGDLVAQAACLEVAERRMLEICERYGPDGAASDARGPRTSERGARARRAREAAAGVFEAEDLIDDDGVGGGPVPDPRARHGLADRDGVRLHGHARAGRRARELHVVGTRLRRAHGLQGDDGPGRAAARTRGSARSRIVCPPGTIFTAPRPAPVARVLRGDRAGDRPRVEGARAVDARAPDRGELRLGVLDVDRDHPPGHRARTRCWSSRRPEGGARASSRTARRAGLGRRRRDLHDPGRGLRAALRDPGRAVRVRHGGRRRRGPPARWPWHGARVPDPLRRARC